MGQDFISFGTKVKCNFASSVLLELADSYI
jgi:hypothetical protein